MAKTEINGQLGNLVVGCVVLDNGTRTTYFEGDPRVAIRILAQAMEDVRDQIYERKEQAQVQVAPAIPSGLLRG